MSPARLVAIAMAIAVLSGCAGSAATKTGPTTASTQSAAPQRTSAAPQSTAPKPIGSQQTGSASGQTSASPTASAATAVFVIHIRNFAYVPAAPVVRVGQPIMIINDDTAAHTWSASPKSNWSYTSGNLEKGQRVTFVGLTRPGRYPFLCYYHAEMPSMNGVLTVVGTGVSS